MRECGGCTLCCRLEKIPGLKGRGEWCRHCVVGKGCAIYARRPNACAWLRCLWLDDEHLGDELRPDKVHLYAKEQNGSHVVAVDPDHPEAWRNEGKAVVDRMVKQGHHVLVHVGDQVNFVAGRGAERPELLQLEWHL